MVPGDAEGLTETTRARAQEPLVIHATEKKYFRPTLSTTFHGRDVFAPLAGALSLGVEPATLGPSVADYVKLTFPAPRPLPEGALEGSVIHIDRFGNCVTNITPEDCGSDFEGGDLSFRVGEHEIRAFRRFFAEDATAGGEPFVILGSAGLLEIAVYLGSAARLLGLRRGQKVTVQSSKFKVQS